MSVLMLVIAVMFSVLVSNIASRFIPKVSTPIVQIALGVAWFMIPSTPLLEIDSELFMTLFIAPLLFLEARNMSRSSLNRNIKQCLSLAVGLVLLSVVIIGFSLHMIWPAIPLATAFALGAALGPTDAVAVTSIGRECGFPKRIMAILRGECLFNDAASIVSFEFATAAATGYSFSAGKFAQSISYNFIFGILLGYAVGLFTDRIVFFLRSHRMEGTNTRICIELIMPFVLYVSAEHFHISGVLTVVSAGLTITFHRTGMGSDIARVNLVANSIWDFLDFTMNGSIFVLLGMQLSRAFNDNSANIFILLGITGALFTVLYSVRFAWIFAMSCRADKKKKKHRTVKETVKSSLIMTAGGVKGAVSLILIFTLPYAVEFTTALPLRNTLNFIAAAYIVMSFLAASVLIPLLSSSDNDDSGRQFNRVNKIMLNYTLKQIADLRTDANAAALSIIMRSYTKRINRINSGPVSKEAQEKEFKLRREMLLWEKNWLAQAVENEPSLAKTAGRLTANIDYTLDHNAPAKSNSARRQIRHNMHMAVSYARSQRARLSRIAEKITNIITPLNGTNSGCEGLYELRISMLQAAIAYLATQINNPNYEPSIVSSLLEEYRDILKTTRFHGVSGFKPQDADEILSSQLEELRAQAFRIELEVIRNMQEKHSLTREQAKRMRTNVHVMQTEFEL